MSSSGLVRWGGLSALIGGVFLAALNLFHSYRIDGPGPAQPDEYLFTFLLGLATLLLAGGLVGLHARHAGARDYGRLGASGFLLAFGATLVLAALLLAAWFIAEASAEPQGPGFGLVASSLTALTQAVGLVLLGAATVRARVLALPWAALPLAIVVLQVLASVAAPAYFALGGRDPGAPILDVLPLVASLCWALIGYALLSGRGEGVGRPTSVR